MGKWLVFLVFFISADFAAAQANLNDALSRMERTIESSQDEFTMRDKYFLGRTVAAQILSRYRIYTGNSELTNYVNLICRALAVNSSMPDWYNGYFTAILDASDINAFSTPGGHIFITRGFLDIASSEDMLAAVIAHELAHIQLNHATEDIMNARLVQRLEQEQQRISRSTAGDQQLFNSLVDEIVQSLFGRGYSQQQEFEADLAAFNMLAAAGYNPRSLIDLLRLFERQQPNQMGGLNATHPLPSQRIANLERQTNVNRLLLNTESARRNRFNRIMER